MKTILFYRDTTNDSKSSTSNFDIGLLKASDLNCFTRRGNELLTTLQDADLTFIAREKGKTVHHTCVSLKSFIRPGSHQQLYVGDSEAFVYEVYTDAACRGSGIGIDVLNFINDYLYNMNIRRVFTYVANDNTGSKRLFHKAGYRVHGKQYLLKFFHRNICVVLSKRRCFTDPYIFRLPFVQVYRSTLPDMERIDIEMKPFVKEWEQKNLCVALFGGGAHSRLLLENISFPRHLIRYVFDNDPKKHGKVFDPLRLIIHDSERIVPINPDIIIVSSKNFQDEISLQLLNNPSVNARIVECYPKVACLSEPGD